MADEASHCHDRVDSGATELLAAVDELDSTVVVGDEDNAVGVLGDGVDFVIFLLIDVGCVCEGVEVPVRLVGGVDVAEVREPTVMEDHRALTLFSTKLFVVIDAIDLFFYDLFRCNRKES